MITPRVRKRSHKYILFDGINLMNYVMFHPVYQELKKNEKIKVFFTNSPHGIERAIKDYTEVGIEKEQIISPKKALYFKWDVFIVADFTWHYPKRNCSKIYLGHGVGGNKRFGSNMPYKLSKPINNFDFCFFAGEGEFEKYKKHLPPKVEGKLVGYPKIDCLAGNSYDRTQIFQRVNLDPAMKTIMFASTWGVNSLAYTAGEEIIDKLVNIEGYNKLITLHCNNWERDDYSRSLGKDWENILSKYSDRKDTYIIKDYDWTPYSFISDCLICDNSSLIFEYSILNRPIIYYEIPEAKFCDSELKRGLVEASCVIRNPDELKAAIQYSFKHKDKKARQRGELADYCFYKPGSATERAVDIIYDILKFKG